MIHMLFLLEQNPYFLMNFPRKLRTISSDYIQIFPIFGNPYTGHSLPWNIWRLFFFFVYICISILTKIKIQAITFVCLPFPLNYLGFMHLVPLWQWATNVMAQLQVRSSRETNSRCMGEKGKGGLFKLANVPPTTSLGRKVEAPKCLHGK